MSVKGDGGQGQSAEGCATRNEAKIDGTYRLSRWSQRKKTVARDVGSFSMEMAAMVMKESGGELGLFEEKEESGRKRRRDGRLPDGAGLP